MILGRQSPHGRRQQRDELTALHIESPASHCRKDG
jgi:hypothetical protein